MPATASKGATQDRNRFIPSLSITPFDSSGYGNSALGAKWRFYDDKDSGTSFAIKSEIIFPVSDRRENAGLGTDRKSVV